MEGLKTRSPARNEIITFETEARSSACGPLPSAVGGVSAGHCRVRRYLMADDRLRHRSPTSTREIAVRSLYETRVAGHGWGTAITVSVYQTVQPLLPPCLMKVIAFVVPSVGHKCMKILLPINIF